MKNQKEPGKKGLTPDFPDFKSLLFFYIQRQVPSAVAGAAM